MSKYIEIYNEIVSDIENGNLEVDSKLPSEAQLMEKYSVSRDTIRKSLNLLEQNGYIQKSKGKGSFVLDINKFNFPVSGIRSFKELIESMGKEVITSVEELSLRAPSKKTSAKLELSSEDYVWKIVRVRKIDGERIILDKDYFNAKFVPTLTLEVCKDSIYNYIEGELGLKISYAKK